jgi:hypothetical protein
MADLSEAARSVLRRYRAAESLRAGEKERLVELIRRREARGDAPRFPVHPMLPGVPASSTWLLQAPLAKWLAGLGLAAAVTVPVAMRHAARPSVEVPSATRSARGSEHAAGVATIITAPAAEAEATPPTVDNAEPTLLEKTKAKRARRAGAAPRSEKKEAASPVSEPAPPPEATIDEEVHLLTAAQVALRTGKPHRAVFLLDEHARRFPRGRLSDAREVAWMTALCDLGQTSQARERAERFLSEHPRSPFSDRVRSLCVPARE